MSDTELKVQSPTEIAAERDTANQLLGRIQFARSLTELLTVSSLMDMQRIKESKGYKHLTSEKDGKMLTVSTWDEYCQLLGTSSKTIDENLRNLREFGANALESMQRAGLGYRQLRQLRQLSEDDRNAIVAEVEADVGDKDAIVELIDNLSAKHAEDRAAKNAEIKKLKADAKAVDRLLSEQQDNAKKLHAEITELKDKKAPTQDERLAAWLKTLGDSADGIQIGGSANGSLGSLRILLGQLLVEYDEHEQSPPPPTLTKSVALDVQKLRAELDSLMDDFGLWQHVDQAMNAGGEMWSPDASSDLEDQPVVGEVH